jgi:hypothetical protein
MPQRLFATPRSGGISGEDDDILFELLAADYGSIIGGVEENLMTNSTSWVQTTPPCTVCCFGV